MSEELSEKSTFNSSELIVEKIGMTRVFDENGAHVPVTVVKLIENKVVQVKTIENDGYQSLKISYKEKRATLLNRPKSVELRVEKGQAFSPSKMTEVPFIEDISVGQSLAADNFSAGSVISVTGTSKGKGFAGVMKKYGFAGGPAAHGSKFHRTTGSIGNRATPGRVWKGKKMPGHMGCETKTIKNIKIQEQNLSEGYLLLKGSVPGHKNSFLRLKLTNKGA